MQLPDYLWGIETEFWYNSSHSKIEASRLPMRNWNENHLWESLRSPSFQTTYEELKHEDIFAEEVAKKRFQTTYEELKQKSFPKETPYTFASRLPMRNWNSVRFDLSDRVPFSFQTTYEELKRRILSGPVYESGRFQTTYEELKHPTEPATRYRVLLPDYLWGIETADLRRRNERYRDRFQTTYEELKPC